MSALQERAQRERAREQQLRRFMGTMEVLQGRAASVSDPTSGAHAADIDAELRLAALKRRMGK